MKTSVYSFQYNKLRKWLKSQREVKSLSIRDVARMWGRHHSIVGKIEQSRRKIELIEFIELCKILDADPHEGLSVLMQDVTGSSTTNAPEE